MVKDATDMRLAKIERMKESVRKIITGLGEDIEREGLLDTPKRVAKALLDVTAGYNAHPDSGSVLGGAFFHEPIVKQGNSGLVLVRDIDFASTCEETMLPFHGKCHVAYIPGDGVVLGLSKLARLTKFYAKRLQSQQRLGMEIGAALEEHLASAGVAVILEARHLLPCEGLPPINTTVALSGCFVKGSSELEELEDVLGIYDMVEKTAPGTLPIIKRASTASNSSLTSMASTPEDLNSSADEGSAFDDADIYVNSDNQTVIKVANKGSDINLDEMETAVNNIIYEIGEDVNRQGVRDTAHQYIRSLLDSTSGYNMELDGSCRHKEKSRSGCFGCKPPSTLSSKVVFSKDCSAKTASAPSVKLVHIKVPFHSQCEHHMLPFYGHAHITCAFPADSAAAKQMSQEMQTRLEGVVAMFTRRLQVQERITHQVADAVAEVVSCAGVMVVVDAAHMCMVARGVENHAGSTTSSAARGIFCQVPELRRATMQEARRLTMRV